MKKLLAFTLAEVLVTLGIIGVVSAMTIPTLMRHHQKTVYVNQLKKAYSEIAQGLSAVIDDHNAISISETGVFDRDAQEFIRSTFKAAQVCQRDKNDCMPSKYKDMYGDEVGTFFDGNSYTCATLSDGVSFCIEPQFPQGSPVYIDINGKQGPNVLGRDLFCLVAKNNGELVGSREDWDGGFYQEPDGSSAYGTFFSRILRDGWKMDY